VELRHKDRSKAESLAHEAWGALKEAKDFQLRILGPVEAPLARLEGFWRIHLLLRGDSRTRLRAVLAKLLDGPLGRHSGRQMLVEIDPYNLM
jgi:primosomal protein N'